MDFQTSMTQLQTQAGASAKEMKYLEHAVLNMGHTRYAAKELSEALYPIRSDGFQGAKALEVLRGAAAGAQVSGASLTLTANALGGTLRTRLKDVHNAAGAMQLLNSTVGLGKFKLEELDEALTTGFLTAAKRAGIGLAETGDALDALARKSVPPQVEATRLQKTLIQFETVTGVAKKYLGKIGIGQLQLAEDMKNHGLIFALQELKKHLASLSSAEQNVVLGEAFGRSKGSANVGALLESLPEMEKIQKQREKYGSIFKALGIKETTASFKMAEAIANFKNTLVSLGQVLIPTVIPALVKFAKFIQGGVEWVKRLPKPLKDMAVGFTFALAVGGPLLIFFGNMISAMGSLIGGIGKLSGALSTGLAPALKGAAADSEAAGTAAFASLGTALGAALVGGIVAYIATNSGPKWFQKLFGIEDHHTILHEAEQGTLWGLVHPNAAGPSEREERSRLRHWEHHGDSGGSQGQGWRERGFHSAREAALAIPMPPIHTHITLQQVIDGKAVAQNTVTHIRHDPALAKPMAESVTKYAQFKAR
jgi:TP901 family phage tail tape measure protein